MGHLHRVFFGLLLPASVLMGCASGGCGLEGEPPCSAKDYYIPGKGVWADRSESPGEKFLRGLFFPKSKRLKTSIKNFDKAHQIYATRMTREALKNNQDGQLSDWKSPYNKNVHGSNGPVSTDGSCRTFVSYVHNGYESLQIGGTACMENNQWVFKKISPATQWRQQPGKQKQPKQIVKKSSLRSKVADATSRSKDSTPPSIQIASSITVKEDSPTIRGKVSDKNKVVQVTVNGVESSLSGGSFSFQRYVPLTGTKVTIEAVDEWGNRSKKTVSLKRKETQVATNYFPSLNPTKFSSKKNSNAVALIIGIQNYTETFSAKFADRDATFFRDYARRKLGVPERNIKMLTNEKADLSDIIKATNVWLPSATQGGQSDIYVFFAGHGLVSESDKEIYLLPQSAIPQVLDQTAIQRKKLFDDIASTQPRSVTVFLDTCYSGTSRNEETLVAQRGIIIVPIKQSIPANFTVFSAAGMKQTAKMLDEAEHGLFSYYLMKGMEGDADSNKDKQITSGELHNYVLANVTRLQRNQTPEMQGDSKRVLVRW